MICPPKKILRLKKDLAKRLECFNEDLFDDDMEDERQGEEGNENGNGGGDEHELVVMETQKSDGSRKMNGLNGSKRNTK